MSESICIRCGLNRDQNESRCSYCVKCKREIEKQRYAEKRKSLGKEPRRIGANPICKCGQPKENLSIAYCNKCKAEHDRLLRQFRKEHGTARDEKCTKCGNIRTGQYLYESSWCSECVQENRRKLRAEKKANGIKFYGENRKTTCNKCNLPKEENYINDSLCSKCRSETNRDKRILARAKRGLLLWGSGRKKTCSTCGKLKEESRKNESRCKKCTTEAATKNTLKNRVEQGLSVWAWRLTNKCLDCNQVRENLDIAHCNRCHNRRKVARAAIRNAIRRNEMQKLPCEICGNKRSEGHHDDYTKPLIVRWLCRKHHKEYHANEDNHLT